jgi:hypothetical protein
MTTIPTETVKVTIDASFAEVTGFIADPKNAHIIGSDFFAGPLKKLEGDEWLATVPRMGGEVRYRHDVTLDDGVIDIYLAAPGEDFGPPLPVRVVPNGDGVDVLWTLARFPGVSDEEWDQNVNSMKRELERVKARLES